MFHYTVETEKSVEEAVNAVESCCSKRKFGVLWQLNIPTKLMEKGINLDQEYRVLEVCNPDVAKKVLTHNQQGGYFLPCKIVIYADSETKHTKIGLVLPTELMKLTGDNSLQHIVADTEQTLIEAIDEAKAT